MRARLTIVLLASAAIATSVGAVGLGRDGARQAAETFGSALTSAKAASLRPILPARGKVHLALDRLGPEEGIFGASQVEAVFRDFLSAGKVGSFELTRCESDGRSSALAHARASVTGRDGRAGPVGIHLGFQPEDGRWVLREVREIAE